MTPSKPKIETKTVKHVFTDAETAELNTQFRQAFGSLKVVTAEYDNVKATYKAKTTEAESRMETLNTTLQAGFAFQNQRCRVVLDLKDSKKLYFLEDAPEDAEPVLIEPLTDADRQQELIEAESRFDLREEIDLFEPAGTEPVAGSDQGVIVIGRLEGKWFTALRVKIGQHVINERLDSEQPCSKKRYDQIKRACKRFTEWLEEKLGREESKGFKNAVELVKAQHAEREE